jgi:hypothetical protein
MAKPLISRNLIDPVDDLGIIASDPASQLGLGYRESPNWAFDTSAIMWITPRKGIDLQQQMDLLSGIEGPTATKRLLFRKIKKSFDEKTYQLATAQQEIRSLEARIEDIKPRKRQKVRLSPNSKFADIEAVRRAQIEAGDIEASDHESDDTNESDSEVSCIIVAN